MDNISSLIECKDSVNRAKNQVFSAKSTFTHHFVSFCRVRWLILVDFVEPSIVIFRNFAPVNCWNKTTNNRPY